MKNVQITVDENLLAEVDRVCTPMGLNRSQVVRQALREWLRRHAIDRFEREWIDALQAQSDDAGRADAWLGVQTWTEK
jgi:metal-responsive CopG/Arc/MetJ family transcriptional regulator